MALKLNLKPFLSQMRFNPRLWLANSSSFWVKKGKRKKEEIKLTSHYIENRS